MQTIEISDKLYKEILAHKQGQESISKVIERNFKPEKSQLENDINKLDAEIRASRKWLAQVAEKANEKGISVEEQLFLDAEYIFNHRMKKKN